MQCQDPQLLAAGSAKENPHAAQPEQGSARSQQDAPCPPGSDGIVGRGHGRG